MKIVITGGHITPALALLSGLCKKHTVVFIGRKHAFEGDSAASFEQQAIKEYPVVFKTITTARLQRRITSRTIPSLFKFPQGVVQALALLLSEKPDIIFSLGGYVALPVCIAAKILGIPIVTHEQTREAGLANRFIGIIAKKICISNASSRRFFPAAKTVLTGNPLRGELFTVHKKPPFDFPIEKTPSPLLYVTGGSGGSHSINERIKEILPNLLGKYRLIHQTGDTKQYQDFEQLKAAAEQLPPHLQKRYMLRQFVSAADLSWIYRHATLLVGRGGANTVYEILTFGIPSLLIPLVWGQKGEQEANAALVEKVGLGVVLPQEKATPERLLLTIDQMVRDSSIYKAHASQGKTYILPDGDKRIIAILEEIMST